ncbi:LysR family transcriptional regulator [Streptomyces pristinaespiralis]|jgi:DNA-binding transcriptional LysR family regulator|uniref:LysR family transcriptional regulator n=2 Tax=Streptomyces pristinaespiralis TaxID=38300 RepID=D6X8W0_STRE2|nr:LysR family transcriptional regulator [Streptomyces pristinaespiralis]EFH31252.1 LysR family transcriptional regulator [Streptomyces pristinaespiralis ATCC 25486]QMU15541.1 LysR family transcriptional regulator [Streptomyces pristinaespiralis]
MDIRQLATFHKVATLLSFTRAAVELKYAQSSVTAHVKALEESLEVNLFDRLGGRVELTDAGRRLLPYAEQMLALAGEARGAALGSEEPAGVLTVGSMESITSYRMPPLLEFFHHRHPALQIVLRPSLCAETCHALRQGMFDMGFLMEAETQHPGVQTEVLGSEPLTVVAAPDHPLTRAEKVTTDDLRATQVISAEAGCAYRELFEAELNDGTGESLPFLEFGTIESIKRGVAAGLGISLLPSVTVADSLESGTLVTLPWTIPFEVHTQIAWRRGKTLSREMRVFIDQTIKFLSEEYARRP